MSELTTTLVQLTADSAVLGGVCWLLLGWLYAVWEPSGAVKAAVAVLAPFVVAGGAYAVLVALGATPWTVGAAEQVAGTALLAVLGAKTWHESSQRLSGHLTSLIQIVVTQLAIVGATSISGAVVGGNLGALDATLHTDAQIAAHLEDLPK